MDENFPSRVKYVEEEIQLMRAGHSFRGRIRVARGFFISIIERNFAKLEFSHVENRFIFFFFICNKKCVVPNCGLHEKV